MAVPKKKTSKSRRNMRRSHLALNKVNVVIDKTTGEYRLSHNMCSVSATYNNKKIVVAREQQES